MKKQGSDKRNTGSSYAEAGVDIDEMMAGLNAVRRMVKATATEDVLGDMGSFGGLFRSPGLDHVLVASTDGVGTKLKVAAMADRHRTVGADLVNHCVNDILVQGATPLFFLDYLGTAHLQASVFRDVLSGLCKACRQNGCALLGGETAEMPGLYPESEYDLVGTIVGTVNKRHIVTGETIREGDVIIGLRSSGLHTNGYSLARRVVFETAGLEIDDTFPGSSKSVADVLLTVHRSYLKPVTQLLMDMRVHGMAHITGGGLFDNVPRLLPDGLSAVIRRTAWKVPDVFQFIQDTGSVDPDEMYRVFNMGIGFAVVVREKDSDRAVEVLRRHRGRPVVIGHIEKGTEPVRLV